MVAVVGAKAQRRRPLSQCAPAGYQPCARGRFAQQPYCSRLDVIAQSPARRIKGSMIGEICSRVALKLADQHGGCDEGVVLRIFISQPLAGLSGRRRMTSLQRVQYIVAKHDITAIGENVELHGGGSEKWVAQSSQVSSFDGASEPPAVFAFSGLIRHTRRIRIANGTPTSDTDARQSRLSRARRCAHRATALARARCGLSFGLRCWRLPLGARIPQ